MSLILAVLLSQEIQVEAEARLSWSSPKFRVRDGESWLSPSSVFSRELDAEASRLSPGGALRAIWGDERAAFEFWSLRGEGDGTLDEPKDFGGETVPAGTKSDVDLLFQHMELGWRHRFALWEPEGEGLRLWADAGVDIEYLVFDADLGFGQTRLDGVFPTPQVSLGFRPVPWLELEAGVGGFFIPFVNGDVDILDPIQYRLSAGICWGRWMAKLGYDLYHVHLEENADDPEEDVVHLRLRAISLSLTFRF